jgi:hypothetical protein
VIDTDCIGRCKSNYHKITTTTAPIPYIETVKNWHLQETNTDKQWMKSLRFTARHSHLFGKVCVALSFCAVLCGTFIVVSNACVYKFGLCNLYYCGQFRISSFSYLFFWHCPVFFVFVVYLHFRCLKVCPILHFSHL